MDMAFMEIVLSQFPSFTGLLVAILILWQVVKAQEKRIERLIEALIKAENCPDEE